MNIFLTSLGYEYENGVYSKGTLSVTVLKNHTAYLGIEINNVVISVFTIIPFQRKNKDKEAYIAEPVQSLEKRALRRVQYYNLTEINDRQMADIFYEIAKQGICDVRKLVVEKQTVLEIIKKATNILRAKNVNKILHIIEDVMEGAI